MAVRLPIKSNKMRWSSIHRAGSRPCIIRSRRHILLTFPAHAQRKAFQSDMISVGYDTTTLLAAIFKMASVDHAVEYVVSNSDADELS